jgi:hypothetical protein
MAGQRRPRRHGAQEVKLRARTSGDQRGVSRVLPPAAPAEEHPRHRSSLNHCAGDALARERHRMESTLASVYGEPGERETRRRPSCSKRLAGLCRCADRGPLPWARHIPRVRFGTAHVSSRRTVPTCPSVRSRRETAGIFRRVISLERALDSRRIGGGKEQCDEEAGQCGVPGKRRPRLGSTRQICIQPARRRRCLVSCSRGASPGDR